MDESLLRLIVFFSILLCMALVEFFYPRRRLLMGYKRWPANLGIIALDVIVARLILPAGAVGAALWADEHAFGLFNQPDDETTSPVEVIGDYTLVRTKPELGSDIMALAYGTSCGSGN